MPQINRGELVHASSFTTSSAACRFSRMIAANVTRFVLVDVAAQGYLWVVNYCSRSSKRAVQEVCS